MIEDLRALGVKAPIATTNYWGGESLFSVPSLTDGDVIDVHSYGRERGDQHQPEPRANFLSWIAAAKVYGKPLTITEWNVQYPQVDRFTAPLYVASIAALQGWDAPMIYNYSQVPLTTPGRPRNGPPSSIRRLTGVMPAAALAYRQGHISPAKTTYCLMLNQSQLFGRALSPSTSATIRTLTEQSRLTIGMPSIKELPWLKASQPSADTTVLTDPDHDFIPAGQAFVRSEPANCSVTGSTESRQSIHPKPKPSAGGSKERRSKHTTRPCCSTQEGHRRSEQRGQPTVELRLVSS